MKNIFGFLNPKNKNNKNNINETISHVPTNTEKVKDEMKELLKKAVLYKNKINFDEVTVLNEYQHFFQHCITAFYFHYLSETISMERTINAKTEYKELANLISYTNVTLNDIYYPNSELPSFVLVVDDVICRFIHSLGKHWISICIRNIGDQNFEPIELCSDQFTNQNAFHINWNEFVSEEMKLKIYEKFSRIVETNQENLAIYKNYIEQKKVYDAEKEKANKELNAKRAQDENLKKINLINQKLGITQ